MESVNECVKGMQDITRLREPSVKYYTRSRFVPWKSVPLVTAKFNKIVSGATGLRTRPIYYNHCIFLTCNRVEVSIFFLIYFFFFRKTLQDAKEQKEL